MTVELLDSGADDDELAIIAHLRPMLPDGQVANSRMPDDPLPFIIVEHVEGRESVEESYAESLVAVYCLHPKGVGNEQRLAATQFSDEVHRRMTLLARDLPDVLLDSRAIDIQSCSVNTRPKWVRWGDDQILCRMSRYQLALDYAKIP